MTNRIIRQAQAIAPYGIGAICDIEGESFVVADMTRWRRPQLLEEPRLAKVLGVRNFRTPPVVSDFRSGTGGSGIPFYRFPRWLFCQKCRHMTEFELSNETGRKPLCPHCRGKQPLTPMRFVSACPNGHLDDVPWVQWCHQGRSTCGTPRLKFTSSAGGSGLEYVFVECATCRARHSLAGIASRDSLRRLGKRCSGRQPWQNPAAKDSCDAVPQVLQRGATNLTFLKIESSIDIPPFSNYDAYADDTLKITNHPLFEKILSSPEHPAAPMLIDMMAADLSVSVEEVNRVIQQELRIEGTLGTSSAPERTGPDSLLAEEYDAFLSDVNDTERKPNRRDRFLKRTVDLSALASGTVAGEASAIAFRITSGLGTVVQVTRLREVRALVGFSRLSTADSMSDDDDTPGTFSQYSSQARIAPRLVPADLGSSRSDWLPAVETYGEGIFLTLDEIMLSRWETLKSVKDRISPLMERAVESGFGVHGVTPSPRYVLLHTLSHLLLRQLSFESGYSLSALKERIYCRTADEGLPMAGILIYTASGDSEGTLGGLVRAGEAERIVSSLLMCIQDADWCSSDPLCRESNGQGLGAMNLAACHACSLVPETSCTASNRLLDRTVVLGTLDDRSIGFFGEALSEAYHAMAATSR